MINFFVWRRVKTVFGETTVISRKRDNVLVAELNFIPRAGIFKRQGTDFQSVSRIDRMPSAAVKEFTAADGDVVTGEHFWGRFRMGFAFLI